MTITPARSPGATIPPQPTTPAAGRDADTLLRKAQAFEAAFLAEMLDHAGASPGAGAFGGGPGEDQFASFLREEQARLMVSRGGFGLAEHLLRSMGGNHVPSKP